MENTVGKGEIACYEQFLFFPQYFQKACFPEASKGVIVWEWVKQVENSLRAISPFSPVFSEDLYRRHVKTMAYLGKG